jgi:DNA polymerase-3 subunit alpha
VGAASRARSDAAAGQESLFAAPDPGSSTALPVDLDPPIPSQEFSREDFLAAEKEALGLYVSSHPLQDCRNQLARAVTCGLGRLDEHRDGAFVTVGGIIGAIKSITTRRGEPMMFVRLDDLEGSVEVVVVPAVLAEARDLLVADAIVLMTGRIDQKGEGETKLVARTIEPFAVDPDREEHRLTLRVHASRLEREHLPRLRQLLVDHGGEAPVVMVMETDQGAFRYRFGDQYRVNPRDGSLQASLKTLFGEECVGR